MSDLDITIKLDPAQAVSGAKAVSSATKTVEKDARSAESAYDQLAQKLSKAAAEMDKLAAKERSAAASSAAKGIAGRAPGLGSQIGSAVQGGAMNALMMGVGAAGFGSITDGIMTVANAWTEYNRAQTEAFNSLRKYFPDAERTNQVLEAQSIAASRLGVDVREAADALGSVREASSGAYLSTLEQIDVTKTLGEIMQLNGKPIGAMADVMKQLQLAMEVGNVTGLQFRTMLRENSDVVGVLSEHTGKSAKELLDMAQAGKFGREMIGEWFSALADGDAVHAKYNERQKTGVDLLIDSVTMLREARNEMEAQNRAALEAADAWEKFGLKYQKMHDDIARAQDQARADDANKTVKKTLDDVAAAVESARSSIDKYNESQRKAAQLAKQHADEAERLRKELFDGPSFKPGSNKNQFAIEQAQRAYDTDVALKMDALSNQRPDEPNLEADLKSHMGGKNPWDAATEKAQRYQATVDDLTKNSLASLEQAAQSVGDALVDAFMDGKLEADKLFDSLARMLAKAAVNNLIGFGFAQLQPAATGLDAIVGAGVPRFASGGDAMVGGAGGTDSRLAMLRVTPGESIHVRTPQQREAAARASGSGNVRVVNQLSDRRSLLQDFDSPEGERVVLNILHRNQGAVRSLIPG